MVRYAPLGNYTNLMTNDGVRTVCHIDDVVDLIEDFCGLDVARYVEEVFDDLIIDANAAREQANSDYRCMEQSLEEFHLLLIDTMDELEEVQQEIYSSKRLNKDKLCGRLGDMSRNISQSV